MTATPPEQYNGGIAPTHAAPFPTPSHVPAPLNAGGYHVPQFAGQPGYVGNIRSTGSCIALSIVTLGIYTWFWAFKVHQEMKDHSGRGMGGAVGLLLWIIPLVSWLFPFLTSSTVGDMYRGRGMKAPVSGATGAWIFLPLLGGLIWFIKTNGALNNYWRQLGAN